MTGGAGMGMTRSLVTGKLCQGGEALSTPHLITQVSLLSVNSPPYYTTVLYFCQSKVCSFWKYHWTASTLQQYGNHMTGTVVSSSLSHFLFLQEVEAPESGPKGEAEDTISYITLQ